MFAARMRPWRIKKKGGGAKGERKEMTGKFESERRKG
jgi:hypothetical protein